MQPAFDKGPFLASGFLRNAKLYPYSDCLHINGKLFSYADIQNMSEIIFAQLARLESLPPFIGVYLDDSAWTYAAILAISAAGGCYVPLNPQLPEKKLEAIIKEVPLSLIISAVDPKISFAGKILVIDQTRKETEKYRQLIHQPYVYLLFTSGSTGEPKGVPVSHTNVRSFLDHVCGDYQFRSDDRFLQPYELSFDVSVFTLFATWECGACVYVVPSSGIRFMNIATTIRDQRITVSSMVPSVLFFLERYLPEFKFPDLRYSFFYGDRLPYRHAAAWQDCVPHGKVINCYGPTETTVVCSSYIFEKEKAQVDSLNGIVPIGKLFPGHDFLIVDEALSETGTGELCIAGPQVIHGYLHHRNRDSFFIRNEKKYYRTGDICSVNSSGDLVFHGRQDSQFKINGYRIEAAEIETAIVSITGTQAIVTAKEKKGGRILVAYIQGEAANTDLNGKLSVLLPPYMIPSEVVFLKEFPLSINGKVDKQKLIEYG